MSKVLANENLVGKNVILNGGVKEKIESVADSGKAYHMVERRAQLQASRLVKVGRNLVEIDRPSAKAIEDSELGYAVIIDPDLYYEVHGKPMRGHKAPKQPQPKEDKQVSDKKSGKGNKGGKKTKVAVAIENLTDNSLAPANELQVLLEETIQNFLTNNYTIEGAEEVNVNVHLSAYEMPDQEGVIANGEFSIAVEVAETTDEVEITEEVNERIKRGLFERADFQKALAKIDMASLELYSKVVDSEGDEFIVAGATVVNKKPALVLQDEEGEAIVPKLSMFARDYSIVETEETDEVDFDEDFLLEDDASDLVDGDELEEEAESDIASQVNENHLETLTDADEITEYLLENYDAQILAAYFNENFDAETKAEKRALASGDAEAIAELIAQTLVDVSGDDGSDDDFDADVVEENDGFESSEEDLASDEDEAGEWIEVDELATDVDDMIDALIDNELLDAKSVRGLEDEDIEELYNANFKVAGEEAEAEEVEAEEVEAEELDVDQMIDALVEGEHLTHRELRNYKTDESIIEKYNEVFGVAEEVEAEDELTVDDVDLDEAIDYLVENDLVDSKGLRKMSDDEIKQLYIDRLEADTSGDDSDVEEIESDEDENPAFDLDDEIEDASFEEIDSDLDEDDDLDFSDDLAEFDN